MVNLETNLPAISDRSGVTDAVRAQILATEHWSLLATRNITWNEIFTRASMFITLLSAVVVALALVGQATDFGSSFRLFALLVLPLVLLLGIVTFIRLGEANSDDIGLVIGMNRLRHAYLELAPELERYFVTGYHDDHASIMQSYGSGYRLRLTRVLGGTPALIAAINVVLGGVIVALIADTLGSLVIISIIVGIVAALIGIAGHSAMVSSAIKAGRGSYQPRFPSDQGRKVP